MNELVNIKTNWGNIKNVEFLFLFVSLFIN